MGVWLAVKTKRGATSSINMVYEMELIIASFQDVIIRLPNVKENEEITNIRIYSTSGNFEMVVQLSTPIAICTQFTAFSEEISVKTEQNEKSEKPVKDCTSVLMANSNAMNRKVPDKINETNNFDKLHNKSIDYLKENGVNWHPSVVSSTGKKFVGSLANLLWHITSHHNTFRNRAASLPKFVNDIFANWNDYIQKKIAKPQLSQNKLKTHIDDVSVFLSQPWMSRYKSFKNDINMLVEACKNVSDWMEKKNIQQNVRHKSTVVEPKYPDIRFIKQSATVPFNHK